MIPSSLRLPFGRILLTGGRGFVGGVLAPLLVAAAPDASRLALTRPGTSGDVDGWRTMAVDAADRDGMASVVAEFRPDLVVHLAAQSSVGSSHAAAEETWTANIGGAAALAGACARHAPGATVLFASSAEVYGASFRDGVVDEDTPPRPQNAYARSKLAAEFLLGDVLPAEGRLIVARSFNHTGPGQDERFVLPSFAAQIARIERGEQPPEMRVGNLDAARDFLDVRDVCDAYLRLLAAAPTLPPRSVFNVSSGTARPIRDLLATLQGLSRVPFTIVVDPDRLRPSDVPEAAGSNARLRHATGWRPRQGMAETLGAVLEGQRGHPGETRRQTVVTR